MVEKSSAFCFQIPKQRWQSNSAERIRRMIFEVHIEGPGTISASIGVASYPNHADDCDQLFQKPTPLSMQPNKADAIAFMSPIEMTALA